MVKDSKMAKLMCPVCSTKINILQENKHKIIVCNECDNSLFMYNTKKLTKLVPFSLNFGIKGNKLLSEEEFDELQDNSEDFDDDDEEDYD